MKFSKQVPGSQPEKKLTARRKWVFRTIAILLPFLILFLLEVSLRIVKYGDNLDLFMEARENPDFLVLNPAASKRYFINQAFTPTGNRELFRKQKDKSILRIFILGESTTIGYPYFHNGSFHRWLQFRLMRTFPERQFEIINLSLTAVNSYTVLGFAKELVKYEPDAVLIYSGHNEFYGTLGVGSTIRIGNSTGMVRLMLTLRELRIMQLLTNLYEKIRKPAGANPDQGGQTLMQRMVADQEIPFKSGLFYSGISQFVSNMNEVLDLFNKNHVPVFISNLVSNEKDLKPFVSLPADLHSYPGFEKNLHQGISAFEANDRIASEKFFKRADQIYDGHALCNFYLGRLAYNEGKYTESYRYFIKAKDLDGLRFRAPVLINEAIVTMCDKYSYIHLVDTKAAFENFSDHQIIGSELILEHVHPNLNGYAIISDVFYEALKKQGIISPEKENEMTFSQLKLEMPVTTVDSLIGVCRISKLEESWPFDNSISKDTFRNPSVEGKIAESIVFEKIKWPDGMDKLYNYYLGRNELKNAARVMEASVLEHPTSAYFYEKSATIYGKMGEFEKAAYYFKRAFAISPSFEYAKILFVIYLKLDEPGYAMPYLDFAIQSNSTNINFLPLKKSAGEIIGLKKEFANDSTNLTILNLIANRYLSMGNKDGASKYVGKILKADPKNKEALMLLDQIKKS